MVLGEPKHANLCYRHDRYPRTVRVLLCHHKRYRSLHEGTTIVDLTEELSRGNWTVSVKTKGDQERVNQNLTSMVMVGLQQIDFVIQNRTQLSPMQ